MLSYVCDFNLRVAGEEAEKYLTTILREWPALYAELPGVHGTLFLANAFALAGEYTYSYRLDVESFNAFKKIDAAIKSDDKRWQKARSEWFGHRAEVRARVLRYRCGEKDFLQYCTKGEDTQVLYTLSYGFGGVSRWRDRSHRGLTAKLDEVWEATNGVSGLQHHTAVIQSFRGGLFEAWARLANLESVDHLIEANATSLNRLLRRTRVVSGLYGVLREVDGALLSGA